MAALAYASGYDRFMNNPGQAQDDMAGVWRYGCLGFVLASGPSQRTFVMPGMATA